MIGRAKPTPAQFFGWANFSTSFFFLLYTSITTLLYFYIPEQVVMVRKSVLTLKYIWKKKKKVRYDPQLVSCIVKMFDLRGVRLFAYSLCANIPQTETSLNKTKKRKHF